MVLRGLHLPLVLRTAGYVDGGEELVQSQVGGCLVVRVLGEGPLVVVVALLLLLSQGVVV